MSLASTRRICDHEITDVDSVEGPPPWAQPILRPEFSIETTASIAWLAFQAIPLISSTLTLPSSQIEDMR